MKRKDWEEEIAEWTEIIEKGFNHGLAYYLRANAKKKIKDYEGALEDYTKAIERSLRMPSPYIARGLLKSILGDYEGAIEDFEKGLETSLLGVSWSLATMSKKEFKICIRAIDKVAKTKGIGSDKAYVYFLRALINKNLKNYRAAIDDFTKVLELNPTKNRTDVWFFDSGVSKADVYYGRGILRAEIGDYLGAVEDLTKAEKCAFNINGYGASLYLTRALARSKIGDCETAINDLMDAAELLPVSLRYHLEKFCGKAKLQPEEYQRKVDEYIIQLVGLSPEHAYGYFICGQLKHKIGDYQGAKESYTRAIELNPEYLEAYIARGESSQELKDYESAVEDFMKAAELARDIPTKSDMYMRCAISKAWLTDCEGVIYFCNKITEIDPTNIEAYYKRARAKEIAGNYEGAIDECTKALEITPGYDLYEYRGTLKEKLGDYNGAIQDYTKAIEVNPDSDTAYYRRGKIREKLGDYNGALSDFTKSIELCSYNPFFERIERGRLRVKMGDYNGAIRDFADAVEKNFEYFHCYDTGSSYLEREFKTLSELKSAIDDLLKIVKDSPESAYVYFLRGAIKEVFEDYSGAVEDYTKAIQLHSGRFKWCMYIIRGKAKMELGEYNAAIDDFKKSLEEMPETEISFNKNKVDELIYKAESKIKNTEE